MTGLTFFINVIKLELQKEKGGQKMFFVENSNIIEFSQNDMKKFRKIILDVLEKSVSLDSDDDGGIGTLAEKQMHAIIKKFICDDDHKHEITIYGSHGYIGSESDGKRRKFIADILDGNTIFEIQTGTFRPLADKIKWILENTTYNIVVVHPIPEALYVSYIESDGTISERRKSPAARKISAILPEIYYLKDIIQCGRVKIVGLMIEADSYKKRQSAGRRRTRGRKYELIPVSLRRAYVFSKPDDYKIFLPEALPEIFTTAMYSKATKIRGIDAYSAVKVLCALGLIEECGTIGKARGYKRNF